MSEENNIPKHWKIKELGQVCKLKNGFAFKSTNYTNEGVPVIRISDINGGIVSSHKAVRVVLNNEYENYLVEYNDILVAMSGATTGKFGIYKSTEKAYQNQRVGKFKILDENVLDNQFLFHQIHSLKRQIEKDAYGGAQPNISSNKIEQMAIAIPPLPEQQAIVSKLEELLSDLENGKQQLQIAQQQLKIYRQSLLKWAFEGKFTNKNVRVGELPKGWKWVKLNEICKIIGGVTKGKDHKGQPTISLPYLRVANVQDGYLDMRIIKTIDVLPSDLEKYRLIYGDILYTEGGDKDKLGRGTIWKNEIQDCIHQNHIFRARPISENNNSKYIAYFSQTKSAKNYFYRHGKQTTNLASINLTILSGLPLPLCSPEEQQLIVDELESKLTVCDKIEETISQSLLQAESLRQSILKKAFEGKLI
jgi:type I restriction enzyme S subunit